MRSGETSGRGGVVSDILPIATFSIAATDRATGDMGVATASRYVAVGSLVPHVRAGVAAVATQSVAHPALADALIESLATGEDEPDAALDRLLAEDASRDIRQFALVTADGRTAAFTGSQCVPFAGERVGADAVCAGNTLTGPEVLEAMLEGFAGTEGRLWDRFLAALDRGDAAGGDARGKQAAAMRVHRSGGGYRGSGEVVVDLRVDDHADPVAELARLLAVLKKTREQEPDAGLDS
ncbi:MAG: DUF1028 domain-containing protein [Spirochaetes bacterium]|jgi:uncharacterized Ntn-hydrolase superfamily protein|nr:DUF1028 domain-containing protein [Spirochaetota bacterium]